MLIDNLNPSLGDTCIPIAKIRAAMEIINPHRSEFEPDKQIILESDIAVGLYHTLYESVQEIEMIIQHNENQEYEEVRVRKESEEDLKKKIAAIRTREVNHGRI